MSFTFRKNPTKSVETVRPHRTRDYASIFVTIKTAGLLEWQLVIEFQENCDQVMSSTHIKHV